MANRSTKPFIMVISLGLIALFGFLFLNEFEIEIPLNSVACNYSSTGIWLTVTEAGRQQAFSLAPGNCTNVLKQDAEAIWGRDCQSGPCQYQAWKLGAGHFEVYNDGQGSVLRIKGWGAGSRWHITREWPKPELSSISYSLVR